MFLITTLLDYEFLKLFDIVFIEFSEDDVYKAQIAAMLALAALLIALYDHYTEFPPEDEDKNKEKDKDKLKPLF